MHLVFAFANVKARGVFQRKLVLQRQQLRVEVKQLNQLWAVYLRDLAKMHTRNYLEKIHIHLKKLKRYRCVYFRYMCEKDHACCSDIDVWVICHRVLLDQAWNSRVSGC